MAEDGFEIGNHTRGHGQLSHTDVGGCQAYVWTLEDEMIANRIPKPTTFCWPFYVVNTKFYPLLSSWGYLFARGGHGRAYRPAVDNPFDVPSFAVGGVGMTMEGFISAVQQATAGRVVVLCFHGVPDGEHPAVGTDPDLFEDMVQYLKDNNYKVIAMRDLAEYIDVAKAAKLPPTQAKLDSRGPALLVKGDKPYIPKKRERKSYVFPSELTAPWTVKEIYRLRLPDSVFGAINGSKITLYVPASTNVKALAPVFELARFAKATPASGTERDFSNPQTYTITAQDGSTRDYTVQVVQTGAPMHFTWTTNKAGSFDDGAQWKSNRGVVSAPAAGGNSDYVLNFYTPGKYTVTRGDAGDFVLNQLNFGSSWLTLTGKGTLVFAKSSSYSSLPYMNSQNRAEVKIDAPIRLDADLTIDGIEADDTRVFLPGLIAGTGALIKNGPHSLFVSNATNTYVGGTVVNDGSVSFSSQGLGAGPVTVNSDGSVGIGGAPVMNSLTANAGRVFSGGSGCWSGPVTLNGNTKVSAYECLEFNNKEGGISGPGGFTQTGHRVDHGTRSGTVKLFGRNTYTGVTRVEMGLLEVMSSLYNNEPARWTPANIVVNGAAGELRLHVGGPGEFTAEQAGTMLRNITAGVNSNGLMAGGTFGLDTADATNAQELSVNIANSKGPGGGRIILKKCGGGTLKLSGASTYSGQTILEGGALSVASLNSVVKGAVSSSLGAPTDGEGGEIAFGRDGRDGDCTLVYTGAGETTDRVMNFAGKRAIAAFDHSGRGLWKFTSTFVLSGYGADKTIVLKGDTSGTGEIAGKIFDPYDRAGKATTAVTKCGTGTWTLSGTNSFTGPTKVTGGVLGCTKATSLGAGALDISTGAKLHLNFTGTQRIAALTFNGGAAQAAGSYGSTASPATNKNDTYFSGTGTVTVGQSPSS
jgi:autotransporter-associated beta strand protein